ncbi:MAG: hypothetical protein BWX80_02207 [Candidatus Hydrogenedentes bacterium ADurb.Bin101]|nr:MAG: hypothetical protein BWX80_02207 [Candidatus Hydrogenedentes bacterium ADurb.Bin101]HOH29591.1 hypothetical protein [Candidatus Hydrogenedentota bacterium]
MRWTVAGVNKVIVLRRIFMSGEFEDFWPTEQGRWAHKHTVLTHPRVYRAEKDGLVSCFWGEDNFFSHRRGEEASYRLALAPLMHNGHVRPGELKRSAPHMPHHTLMNWLHQYREPGADSIFRPPQRGMALSFFK